MSNNDFRNNFKHEDFRKSITNQDNDFRNNFKHEDFRKSISNQDNDFRKDLKVSSLKDEKESSNLQDTLNNKKVFYYQRSPILSNDFIGIGNQKWLKSNEIIISTEKWQQGSELIKTSSELFTSSDDILRYLETHPDFQKVPPSQLDAIIAAILSGLLIVGGVTLAIVTLGTTAPATSLVASFLISTGISGAANSIGGAILKNFKWSDWAMNALLNAGLTLFCFGAGYGTGVALYSKGLSELSIKALGAAAGAIVGAGYKTGSYLIVVKVQNKPVEILKLVLEGVAGALGGASLGFVGAKASLIGKVLATGEPGEHDITPQEMDRCLDESLKNVSYEDRIAYQMLFDKQTTLDAFPFNNEYGRLAIIEGFHKASHNGAGLVHMLAEHPDVFRVLGFNDSEISLALQGVNSPGESMLRRIADSFGTLLRNAPWGEYTRGSGGLIWNINNRLIKVGTSSFGWGVGCPVAIQANIVNITDKGVVQFTT